MFGAPADSEALRKYRDIGVTRAVFSLPSEGADKLAPLLDRFAGLAGEIG